MSTKRLDLVRDTKPSEWELGNHWFETFGKMEKEIIARNVAFVLRARGDSWRPFTWKDYEAGVTHAVGWEEKGTLGSLVEAGFLSLEGSVYHVQESFLTAIWAYRSTST